MGHSLHLHARSELIFRYITGNPAENLIIPVIQNSDVIRQVFLKTRGSILQPAVGDQFSLSLDFKPICIAGKTAEAVGPGREEGSPAFLTASAHDFSLFQIIYEVIDFGNRSEAYCSKLFESIIYLLFLVFLSHVMTSPGW